MKTILLTFVLTAFTLPAATLSFTCLDNNSGTCEANVAPGFSVQINDAGSNQVQFLFSNTLSTSGRIHFALIDEGASDYFSSFAINPTAGTSYVIDNSQTLPGGNSAPYSFTTDHGANRQGGAANGVDAGETLDLRGVLNAGFTYADVISGLATSSTDTQGLRVGLHIQSLPGGFSEGLISTGNEVPEPSTLLTAVAALATLAVRRFRTL